MTCPFRCLLAHVRTFLYLAYQYDKYDLYPKPDSIYLEENSVQSVVSLNEDSIPPNLGVVYHVNDNGTFYVQYIQGFRTPNFEVINQPIGEIEPDNPRLEAE